MVPDFQKLVFYLGRWGIHMLRAIITALPEVMLNRHA